MTRIPHIRTCTRDKELQLQLEEEQRKERELNRRDAALKAKLTAEARVRCVYVTRSISYIYADGTIISMDRFFDQMAPKITRDRRRSGAGGGRRWPASWSGTPSWRPCACAPRSCCG